MPAQARPSGAHADRRPRTGTRARTAMAFLGGLPPRNGGIPSASLIQVKAIGNRPWQSPGVGRSSWSSGRERPFANAFSPPKPRRKPLLKMAIGRKTVGSPRPSTTSARVALGVAPANRPDRDTPALTTKPSPPYRQEGPILRIGPSRFDTPLAHFGQIAPFFTPTVSNPCHFSAHPCPGCRSLLSRGNHRNVECA
jgi:hypothetical protein